MADAAQDLLDLLETNWNSSNTDGKTPTFIKIVHSDFKRARVQTNSDWVIAQVPEEQQSPAGIGTAVKIKKATIKLDIRIIDESFSDYSHYQKVVDEVIRIIDNNMIEGITGWQIITLDDTTLQDLSDKRRGIWRKIIPVRLENYNVSR